MVDDELHRVLAAAKTAGFLGRAPLEDHVRNGLGFAEAIRTVGGTRCADLGSGGGVPALVVARAVPELEITCIDRGTKRCEFLVDAVEMLDLVGRVAVVEGDAEDVCRLPDHGATYDIVTARSFGPPAVTAEAATRFLRRGGTMLVSEPPTGDAGLRWESPDELAVLGLSYVGLVATADVRLARVERTETAMAERYPRRAATVRKRPLF